MYAMRVNSIEAEKFLGTHLSNEVTIGARIKDRSAGKQSEITIDMKSAMVRGCHDVALKKKIWFRVNFQGSWRRALKAFSYLDGVQCR